MLRLCRCRASAVLEAAEEALQAGVEALVVISAGFAEVGREGAARQDRLLELVRSHGGRLIGPNCLGIAVAGVSLNATFAARTPASGNIAFSSQSGALGVAFLEAAEARGLGLSAFVSIGNKADVSSNDLLEWWEDDPHTDVVLLYLESFGNPRRFGRLARRVARRKPILSLKGGTTLSGQRAASSHTAALAGSEAAVDALFHQAGVIRATSLEELIDVGALLSSQPETRGRRVGILTNAGGLGILCADVCDVVGLELPELAEDTRGQLAGLLSAEASLANPVDMLGGATADTYGKALAAMLGDPHLDAFIVLFVPTVTAAADDVAVAIDRVVAESDAGKPVLAVVMTASGIPEPLRGGRGRVAAFAYPESAARALGRAAERADWLRRPHGTVPTVTGIDRQAAQSIVEAALSRGDDVWLEAAEARALLLAYGLPLVPERIAGSAEEAAAAARELGFPVVVKTALAGAHKTDVGGLALDLGDDDAVRAAVERIGAPVLVQPMVEGSCGAAGGDRPGPGLRSARRLRPRWRPRGAHRGGRVSDRAADRPGRRGARPRRKGRPPRSRLSWSARSRQSRPRRTGPSTCPARRRPARRQGARPQPGDRSGRRLRRRRFPGARPAVRAPGALEELVAGPHP